MIQEMYPQYDENTLVIDNKVSDKELFTREVLTKLLLKPEGPIIEMDLDN